VHPWMPSLFLFDVINAISPAKKDIGPLDGGIPLHPVRKHLMIGVGCRAIQEGMHSYCKTKGSRFVRGLKVTKRLYLRHNPGLVPSG